MICLEASDAGQQSKSEQCCQGLLVCRGEWELCEASASLRAAHGLSRSTNGPSFVASQSFAPDSHMPMWSFSSLLLAWSFQSWLGMHYMLHGCT